VESTWGRRSRVGLAVLLLVTGVLHFVVPGPYVRIIPRVFPAGWAAPLVALSGAAELVGGAALLVPAWRRAAGLFVAALLVAVFPANVQMAVDSPNVFTLGRLPLQVPLIWAALVAAQRAAEVDPLHSTSGMGRANR
jgi:uncharacterized membrane protein